MIQQLIIYSPNFIIKCGRNMQAMDSLQKYIFLKRLQIYDVTALGEGSIILRQLKITLKNKIKITKVGVGITFKK